jgi:hypothetical protein
MMMAGTKQLRCFALLVLWWSLSIASQVEAQVVNAQADAAPAPVEALVTQTQPEAQTKALTNYVESGGSYLALSNGYGYWAGGYTRGVYQQGKNIWNAEVNGQHEFGDAGVYMAAGDTYNFNPDWYGSLTLGTSVGGFFWPRYRADAFLNKKWLGRKQWITTAGLGYYVTTASISAARTTLRSRGSSRKGSISTSAIRAQSLRRPVSWQSPVGGISGSTLRCARGWEKRHIN